VTRPLYVETLVRSDLERLWEATQDAAAHTRWDLRFSVIEDVTAQTDDAPRAFRYALHLPGRVVAGTGTSVGERRRPDGTRTSALRFGSPDPLSLIRRGSGWWRYVPTPAGTRFLTGYDYEPGWGRLGRLVDRWLFRRLLGWATAWSFDRLRLWVDDDVAPESAARRWVVDTGLRLSAVAGAGVALRQGSPAAAVLLVVGAAGAPSLPGVPRARRCLRRPPDAVGRTAPASLDRLAAPA
jgi:hypothetical protein